MDFLFTFLLLVTRAINMCIACVFSMLKNKLRVLNSSDTAWNIINPLTLVHKIKSHFLTIHLKPFHSINSKGPIPLYWQMQRGNNNLPSVENAIHPLCTSSLRTYFIRSTHQASGHCDFIRVKSFELHKIFWTDELSAVYDVNLQHIRATNVPCPLSFVKRLRYLAISATPQGERERKDEEHGTSIHR